MPRLQFTFGAADRLHQRSQFLRVQRQGARFQTDHFVIYAASLPESEAVRLGTTVSRRLGKAVIRNQVKRRIRECFRLRLRQKLPAGTAIVIIGRARAGTLKMKAVMGELDRAVAKVALSLTQGHD